MGGGLNASLYTTINFTMNQYTQPILSSSALLTIDMQEDFCRKNALSYVNGTDTIIPELVTLVRHYRNLHRPIIHVIRLYNRDGSNADICRRKIIEDGKLIVTPGSAGAELVRELKPNDSVSVDERLLLKSEPQKLAEQEWIIYKPRWGAFFKTKLEQLLQSLNISTVVITGCNFPNCPRTTIYEASERDYRIVLVKNAVSELYPKGEKELQNIGVALYSVHDIISFSDN